jgi:DNA-binding HxlR family transcriptional regulator
MGTHTEESQKDCLLTNQIEIQHGDELWRAIRKLTNEKTMLIVKTLAEDSYNFSELRNKTGLDTNTINHALIDLRTLGLIIQSKDDKKYSLTKYCLAILSGLRFIIDQMSFQQSIDATRRI